MFLKASTWPHVPSQTPVKKLSFLFFFCIWPATLQNLCRALSIRKSYEFEDLLQSSTDSCRVDWYAQSRLGLTRTLSEENVYEDIIGKQYISRFLFFLNQVESSTNCCICQNPKSFGYKLVCIDSSWQVDIDKYCTVGCPSFYTLHTLHDLLVSFLISVWVMEFSHRGD